LSIITSSDGCSSLDFSSISISSPSSVVYIFFFGFFTDLLGFSSSLDSSEISIFLPSFVVYIFFFGFFGIVFDFGFPVLLSIITLSEDSSSLGSSISIFLPSFVV
jgi:hypothetical protein